MPAGSVLAGAADLLRRLRTGGIHIRYRRALRSFSAAAGNSATSVVVSLLSVPLLLDHLGAERFGVWMTLYSLVALQGFMDLGIGNGLVTRLAHCSGRGDAEEARRLVSSAFLVVTLAALAIAAGFAAAYPLVPWDAAFNVADPAVAMEAAHAAAVLAACLVIGLPAGIARRAQAGYQREYVASLWEMGARWLGLACILTVAMLDGGLVWVALAVLGLPVLGAILNGAVFFGLSSPGLRPSPACLDAAATRSLLHSGFLFFVLQVVAALTFASDSVIVAQVLGPDQVAGFTVPRTLFQFLLMPIGLLTAPLWPAYGEALSRGETAWVRRTLLRSLGLTVALAGGGGLALVLAGDQVLHLWVGPAVAVDRATWAGFAVTGLVTAVGTAVSMVLNAALVVRFQVAVAIALCLCAVPLKILAAGHSGIAGMVWATGISYALVSLLPCLIFLRNWMRRACP